MIPDQQYRPLEAGEIIQPGDQYKDHNGSWIPKPASHCGDAYRPEDKGDGAEWHLPHRRPINTATGVKSPSITIFDGFVTYTYALAPAHGRWAIQDLYEAARKVCDSPETPAVQISVEKATPTDERPTPETDAMSKGFDYRGLPCLEMAVGLCRRLERDRDDARADVVLAAGELMIPLPQPGTDIARLLAANSIMRRQLAEAREQRDEARKSAVCIHEGTAASADGWALMFSEVRKELEANGLVLQKLQNERDEAIQARNHNRVCIERLTVERDRLAALVGTIRQWFDIPLRNVDDITPAEHSREIGSAVEDIKQQRDQLKRDYNEARIERDEFVGKYQKLSEAMHEFGVASAKNAAEKDQIIDRFKESERMVSNQYVIIRRMLGTLDIPKGADHFKTTREKLADVLQRIEILDAPHEAWMPKPPQNLREDIIRAINCRSAENRSNTPDWILGDFLMNCLASFDHATNARTRHSAPDDAPAVEPPTTTVEG